MSLTGQRTQSSFVVYENMSNTPEQALLIALLEDCVRTITSKGSVEEARSEIEWLHGLTESSEDTLSSEQVSDYLDSDIVALLREKYPLDYISDYVPTEKVQFTFHMEERLLELYRGGASIETLMAEFPLIRRDNLIRKAKCLMLGENFTPEEDEMLVDYYINRGYPVYKLVPIFHKNERAITRRLLKLGYHPNKKHNFTEEEQQAIREGVKAGLSPYKIGRKLNRATASVRRQIVVLKLKNHVVNKRKW